MAGKTVAILANQRTIESVNRKVKEEGDDDLTGDNIVNSQSIKPTKSALSNDITN